MQLNGKPLNRKMKILNQYKVFQSLMMAIK
jgi:hypothetical protein